MDHFVIACVGVLAFVAWTLAHTFGRRRNAPTPDHDTWRVVGALTPAEDEQVRHDLWERLKHG